jgi:Na+-transporting NADH:ubiquinone oxidoreductase subunit C
LEHSARHTIIFTTALCVFFSVIVSAVAVALKDRQLENKRLDQMKNVLSVAGLMKPGEKLSRQEINSLFHERLVPKVVDMETGQIVEGADPQAYDARKAVKDPELSHAVPENPSKVRRVPNREVIYQMVEGDKLEGIILPIHGYGLWSVLYGYIALDPDAETIRGITYYEQGETAGLGGEVDNPRWKAKWPGRKVYDENGNVAIHVKKGMAGPPAEDPYAVDGLSGATITSKGVTNMLHFWLGENGFENYLDVYRNERGI